jgi:hypothetical protein
VLLFISVAACGRPLSAADSTSDTGIETGSESGRETESESDGESETDTEETETETTETETTESETGEACDLCEGATEIAEGIVECADGRINRVASGTFDPTISADPCMGDEDVIECTTDSECNSGPYGKCIHSLESIDFQLKTVCSCAYSCSTDDDCTEGSVCVPSGVLWGFYSDPPHWPQCVAADCETGSDCSECGECGMAASHTYECVPIYAIECRTADDICSSDAMCELDHWCYPFPDGVWRCEYVRCIF